MKPHYRLRCVRRWNAPGGLLYWLERDGRRVSVLSPHTSQLASSIGGEL